ncbi:MAG: ABC-type transport auxiliary lipoprotein family protein, partial [Pseudomonadota bacterium]
ASELRGARNHQWAEPLAAGIGRYLALALGEPVSAAPLLELSVAHFHGSERGAVVLEADWQLRERGAAAPFAQGRFDATIMQDGPGFEAMIEAQRALLDQLLTAAGAAAGGRANQKQPAPTNDAAAMSENASS